VDLCVDIGNTNLKWSCLEEGILSPVQSLRHATQNMQGLEDAWSVLPPPQRILAANVAGWKVEQMVNKVSRSLWQLEPRFPEPTQEVCGVTIAYADPKRLGVDRWLTLLAVHSTSMTPALVLDCGTAVTLDAIDGTGRHLGGLILPGLRMMWDSLFSGTRIPPSSFTAHHEMLGRDTAECIAGGALQALVGMTERLHRHLCGTLGEAPLIVLTGSDASKIGEQLELDHECRPDLVLQGLTHLID